MGAEDYTKQNEDEDYTKQSEDEDYTKQSQSYGPKLWVEASYGGPVQVRKQGPGRRIIHSKVLEGHMWICHKVTIQTSGVALPILSSIVISYKRPWRPT